MAKVTADELAVWLDEAIKLARSREERWGVSEAPGAAAEATYQRGKQNALIEVRAKIREGF